jgi:CTP:phosphocholine cytidylyltransferase-like protein
MPDIEFAVIAAAGTGSRLGFGIPKCLLEVSGRSLLGHMLEQVADIPHVNICVGFMADEVIQEGLLHRPDAVFVFNHAYRSTTTLTSYVMAARGISKPVLYMDADIYFIPESFSAFLARAKTTDKPLLAVTSAKTEHCVFVELDETNRAVSFSRVDASRVEWANLAWLPSQTLINGPTAVFEQLSKHLPINTFEIESYEVDTPNDLELLLERLGGSHVD